MDRGSPFQNGVLFERLSIAGKGDGAGVVGESNQNKEGLNNYMITPINIFEAFLYKFNLNQIVSHSMV